MCGKQKKYAPMLKLRNIHLFILCALLTLAGCTTPDHDSEATALGDALLDLAINNRGKALQRVDSAAEAGVFTAVQANTLKAIIYENAGRRRRGVHAEELC
jgi:hypothetical protein